EIKPLFLSLTEVIRNQDFGFGTGFLQANNYIRGFTAFVKRVNQDSGGVTTPATTGTPLDLTGNKIPAALNYAEFDNQNTDPPPAGAVMKRDTNERLWAYAPVAGQ